MIVISKLEAIFSLSGIQYKIPISMKSPWSFVLPLSSLTHISQTNEMFSDATKINVESILKTWRGPSITMHAAQFSDGDEVDRRLPPEPPERPSDAWAMFVCKPDFLYNQWF